MQLGPLASSGGFDYSELQQTGDTRDAHGVIGGRWIEHIDAERLGILKWVGC